MNTYINNVVNSFADFEVLSLFDGLSGTQIALDRLNKKISKYHASEVDPKAIQITQKNYPETNQLGDINNWKDWDIDWSKIGLCVAGFPCQSWSVAGKQKGDRDSRGKLFWVMLDIMQHVMECNPNAKYLMENVRMSNAFEEYITYHTEMALPNVNKYLINSSLVSAQNRKRFYWTNIEGIQQPKDKNIMLKDVLEDGLTDRTKSHCIDANYFKGGNLKSYFEKHRRQLVFSNDQMCHVGDADLKGHGYVKRVYAPEGKAPSLCASSGGNLEPKVLVKGGRIVNRRLDKNGTRKDNDKTIKLQKQIEVRTDDNSNCLTTVSKDSILVENMSWRKLTCLEAERLQTVPDGYTSGVSKTQRYKMLGNGFTVDIIAHILKGI
jgi:DNA (cytosine-5)-methyltransferase 1/DNA (cytosine-5)-methyltransferase 3A